MPQANTHLITDADLFSVTRGLPAGVCYRVPSDQWGLLGDIRLENDRVIKPAKHLEVIAFAPGREEPLDYKYKWKSYCKAIGKAIDGGKQGTFRYMFELLILSLVWGKEYFVETSKNRALDFISLKNGSFLIYQKHG